MEKNYRILITTYPFGDINRKPLELLEATGWDIVQNPYHRRLKAAEIPDLIKDFDAIIAGTEPYPPEALENSNVKVISRVGIGLDNVPLEYCKEKGIQVTYTPDAPSQAVAELTVGQIINLARHIHESDKSVREGAWNRYIGFLIKEIKIGIVGVGRIGKRVIKLLQPFEPDLLVCDIKPDVEFGEKYNLKWVDKDTVMRECDLVTLHIPNNKMNHHFINRKALSMMKTSSYLINTSRGPIVDEAALTDALLQRHLGGAALDVFETEPYEGSLQKFENVVLTAHMGASARESRYLMELGATEDCIRVLKREKPLNHVEEE